jgi:hypothetical protein
MNGAYLHLVVNHVPVVGVPIAFLLLAGGMARKSNDIIKAAFAILVLMALAGVAAWKTGGPAAHIVKDIPGIVRATIHEHAEAADFGLWGSVIMGVLGLVGLVLGRKPEGPPRGFSILVLVGSLWLTTVFIRVAHLGGLIRHPEIESGDQAPAAETPK